MVVVDVLDDIERPNQIVVILGDSGELGKRRTHDAATEPLLGNAPRFVVELQRIDVAELAKHLEIMASPAADLQNRRARGRPDEPADQRADDFSPSAIPPVALIQRRHLIVDEALHQSPPICSRITYSGRPLVSIRMRPTYSPSTPSESSCKPPRNRTDTISEA